MILVLKELPGCWRQNRLTVRSTVICAVKEVFVSAISGGENVPNSILGSGEEMRCLH